MKRNVDVIVGGQWGSEGKGHIVSCIANGYDVLIRTGGPNAGHTVKLESGEKYTFHHLPSGTFHNPEARLILAAGCVINLPRLLQEIEDCKAYNVQNRLYIDANAIIVDEKWDVRMEQQVGGLVGTIGSTGQGVGEATMRKIRREPSRVQLVKNCKELRGYSSDTRALISGYRNSPILVEGTQGTMLSLHHGQWPYVTSRDTTASGCLSEVGIGPTTVNRVILTLRTYPIRVQSPPGGTSGPMGGLETTWDEVAMSSGIPLNALKEAELTSTTKRQRRVARFDVNLALRAAHLNGATDIALTFVDYFGVENRDAKYVDELNDVAKGFIIKLQQCMGIPVSYISANFNYDGVIRLQPQR